MGDILFRIHESYRWVVAVCDKDIFGRVLIEGERVFDASGRFFDGEVLEEDALKEKIVRCLREDATFNFVGEDSVRIAKEMGIVSEEGVIYIEGVPIALVLL